MANQTLHIDKSDWTPTKLGDVVLEVRDNISNAELDQVEHVVGLEHIASEDIHLRKSAKLEDKTTFRRRFKTGDVLFGRRRAYLKKSALSKFEGICSGDITVMRPKEGLLPELFPFIVHNERFFDFAVKHSAGSLSPRVKFKDLANFEFLLPPKDQQAQLAKLLWAMDEVIERESILSDKLKSLFDSFSKKCFNEDVTEYIPLSECSEVIMGQSPPGDSYNQEGEGVPLLNGPTEFTDRHPVKIQWTTKPTKYCEDKDILLCVRGSTTGRMNISNDKYCIGRGVAAIRGKSIFRTDFLEFVLRYSVDEIMRVASGSTFPNIDSKTLKAIKLPKLIERQQDVIIEKLKNLDETRIEAQEKMKVSQSLQKSLINQIF